MQLFIRLRLLGLYRGLKLCFFLISGTVIRYSGVGSATEKIQITGKLSGELQIQVLTLGIGAKARILPPRIKYVYYKVKSLRKTKVYIKYYHLHWDGRSSNNIYSFLAAKESY